VAVRRAALVGGAIAVALAVGLALGWWQHNGSESPPKHSLSASTSLSAETLSFGDPLTAGLDVLVDPDVVDPASVRVRPRFAPYQIVATTVRTRRAGGVLRSYRYSLECLAAVCVPGRSLAERRFLPVLLSYRTVTGQVGRGAVDWPAYRVISRLTSPDVGDPTQRLRTNETLPKVSYRIRPGLLQALLAASSAILVLVAAVLVALLLPRRAARSSRLSPLEQALEHVRASGTNGYPDERRKALGRLARELTVSGRRELAEAAFRLAWSAPAPSGEAAAAFAQRVEATL
jgi:hypothetical protein